MELYKNIKQRRKELGYSQDMLAEKLGYTSRSTISKIEKGLVDLPLSKIVLCAQILKTTPMWLMGYAETLKKKPAETDELREAFIQLYDMIPPDRRAAVLEVLRSVIKSYQ